MPRVLPKPSADTKSVAELVDLVVSGTIRIPIYQRDLQWKASDVLALLDSIYRGYPVGALLLHHRPAAAGHFRLGPLEIRAPELSAAFDVVDGQQRLVALAASLARPTPIPTAPEDPYVVYFDPVEESFRSPPPQGPIPDTWVPLPELAEGARVNEWVFQWAHGRDPALRARIFDASTRLREYKIPLYTVSVAPGDEEVLREIFHRINTAGKRLEWTVIHDALYGARPGTPTPSTTTELAEALTAVGLGRPDKTELLRCLIAFEGKDVTRSYQELEREHPKFLNESANAALPALRRVLSFLRDHGEIPHLRLLPLSAPLPVLTRFFRLHPEPSARSRELLTWWLWRSILAHDRVDHRTLQRRGVAHLLADDEEASVQKLLALVPEPDPPGLTLSPRFDARAAQTRVALLGLASLGPRDLTTGRPIDLATLLEDTGGDAFRRVFSRGPRLSSPGNRIILPGSGVARGELLAAASQPRVLGSHGIDSTAAAALERDDPEGFFQAREATLLATIHGLATRLAGVGRRARPSIDYILRSLPA